MSDERINIKKMKAQIKDQIKKIGHDWLIRRVGRRQDLSLDNWNVRYSDHFLTLHGQSLEKLAEQYKTPLHIVDLEKLEDNFDGFEEASSGSGLTCEVFLSYKTNPIPWTLSFLHERGAGAEVISEYELGLALTLGVPGEKIIYNGPAKSDKSIALAISEEVLMLNINHFEEIERVRRIAAELGKKANVGLRISSANTWAGQFGIPTSGGQALDIFRKLLEIPEFNVVGIHCHRGVIFENKEAVENHANNVLAFCTDLKNELNYIPQIIDFGGSLGVPTTRYYTQNDIKYAQRFLIDPREPNVGVTAVKPAEFAKCIVQAAEEWFSSQSLPPARIIIEPGRSLTGNTQLLLSSVMSTRREEQFTYAIMDAGVNIAEIMHMEFHQIFPVKESNHPHEKYRLVGPICHMGDTLHYSWELPTVEEGDVVAIMDSGAYFVPQSNSFSFLRPAIIAIDRAGTVTLIRHREEESHMLARDVLRAVPY